jgi:hypothetical protein
MDQARPMSRNESGTDLNGNMKSFPRFKSILVHHLAESGSTRKFRGNECHVVLKSRFNGQGYVSM